jgi:hypothetical protein
LGMKLIDYLIKENITQVAFARKCKMGAVMMNRYIKGRCPDPKQIKIIDEASNHQVTIDDWVTK